MTNLQQTYLQQCAKYMTYRQYAQFTKNLRELGL